MPWANQHILIAISSNVNKLFQEDLQFTSAHQMKNVTPSNCEVNSAKSIDIPELDFTCDILPEEVWNYFLVSVSNFDFHQFFIFEECDMLMRSHCDMII